MAETRTINWGYAAIAADLIATEPNLERLRESSAQVVYLSSDFAKASKGRPVYGECERVPSKWHWAAPFDYAVTVYEPNVERMTDAQLRILLHHELLHIRIEEKDGAERYAIEPHDVEDFGEIIRLYGVDWSL